MLKVYKVVFINILTFQIIKIIYYTSAISYPLSEGEERHKALKGTVQKLIEHLEKCFLTQSSSSISDDINEAIHCYLEMPQKNVRITDVQNLIKGLWQLFEEIETLVWKIQQKVKSDLSQDLLDLMQVIRKIDSRRYREELCRMKERLDGQPRPLVQAGLSFLMQLARNKDEPEYNPCDEDKAKLYTMIDQLTR